MAACPRHSAVGRRPLRTGGRRGGHRRRAMTPAPLLDTHAWIWWIEQDARLGSRAIDALDRLPRDERPYLCDISLWEIATLVERGRLSLDVPLEEWLEAAAHPRTVRPLPISPRIAAGLGPFTGHFHPQTADRIILAASPMTL